MHPFNILFLSVANTFSVKLSSDSHNLIYLQQGKPECLEIYIPLILNNPPLKGYVNLIFNSLGFPSATTSCDTAHIPQSNRKFMIPFGGVLCHFLPFFASPFPFLIPCKSLP